MPLRQLAEHIRLGYYLIKLRSYPLLFRLRREMEFADFYFNFRISHKGNAFMA